MKTPLRFVLRLGDTLLLHVYILLGMLRSAQCYLKRRVGRSSLVPHAPL